MTNIELAELLLQYPEKLVKFRPDPDLTYLFEFEKEKVKHIDDYILIDIP